MRTAKRMVGGVVVLSLGLAAPLAAQTVGGGVKKENLDLPYDAIGETSVDEDAPEVINFYSQTYEGDGFFFTVDRSGSMQDSGELTRAKNEISKNIAEFSDKTEFAIVFFDAGIQKFPQSGRPAEASPGMKSAAMGWIGGIPGGGGSCCMQGLREALQYANLAKAKRKVIVYVGDGGGTCNTNDERGYLQQMVSQITSQNYQRAQINAIGVLMGSRWQKDYLKQLCAANGGTYRELN